MSQMTKKHFEAIAKAISAARREFDYADDETLIADIIAERIADFCARENFLFDRNRFLVESGVTTERTD